MLKSLLVMRRSYPIRIMVNGRHFKRVVIDGHYERKHRESIRDEVIIGLVQALDGGDFVPEAEDSAGFRYFTLDPWYFGGKAYRLVWLIPPGKPDFIGVVNAFRRRYGKSKS